MSLKACTEDRISALPDEIVCHILSFLLTVEAVKTSVLSRRWRNAWASSPNIDLRDLGFGRGINRDNFEGIVNHVLISRGSLDIHRFSLYCVEFADFFCFDAWIRTATRLNVIELTLFFPIDCYVEHFELPRSLYMSNTLVVLELRLRPEIAFTPPSNCFPSLKVLKLMIKHLETDSMEKLISCCPMLEDLNIEIAHDYLGTFSPFNFNISAPKLKILQIFLYGDGDDLLLPVYKISFNINTPNLEKFDLQDEFLAIYSWTNAKSLRKAKINFQQLLWFRDIDDDCILDSADRMQRIFAGLRYVKDLSLFAPILGHPPTMRHYHLPAFNNLNHLELFLHTSCSWKLLTNLLKKSPNLKSLFLHINVECSAGIFGCAFVDHVWCTPRQVPICLLSCLKTICIRGLQGRPDEMEAAKYMLKNGEVLDNVIICTRGFSVEDKMKLCQEISEFERASKTCQIEFWK